MGPIYNWFRDTFASVPGTWHESADRVTGPSQQHHRNTAETSTVGTATRAIRAGSLGLRVGQFMVLGSELMTASMVVDNGDSNDVVSFVVVDEEGTRLAYGTGIASEGGFDIVDNE